jgi:WD40 repeat protein
MTDVFVSYSRSDESFVRELVDELTTRGKTAWVDFEGIPPSAEWLAEIHKGIESSDSFLFVISPRSAASEMCQEEVAYAEKHGKRIVPLNLEEVDRTILPAAIADRQWITFADGVPFAESMDTLVGALDTDLDWLRQHTQWLGKAREWEREGRDKSFLLRGAELRAAEAWLTTPGAAEKEPPATPLQNEYVFASRQGATRRQRAFVAAVLVAMVITAGLAVFAALQRSQAISERETAVSELLANLSLQRMGTDLDTALLLGAAAYEVKDTPDARNALLVGAQRAEHVQGMVRALPGATLSATDLSADGRILAAAAGAELAVWDLLEKRLIASTTEAAEIPALALSGDGSLLVVARAGGRVVLYDVTAEGLQPRGQAPRAVEDAVSLALSPVEPLLAVGTADAEIAVFDIERNELTVHEADRPAEFEDVPMPVGPLAFDASGRWLAAGSEFGLHVLRLTPQQRYEGLVELEGVEALDFVDDTTVAVVSQGSLFRIEAGSGERLCGPNLAGLTAVDGGPEGRFVVAGRGTLQLGTDVCGKPSGRLAGQRGTIKLVRFTGRSGELVSVGADSLAVRWTPGRSGIVERRGARSERLRDVVWGVGAGELVVAADSGVWLLAPDAEPRLLAGEGAGSAGLAAAVDAETIAAATGDELRVWRGAEYGPEPPQTIPEGTILNVAVDPGGTSLAAGTELGAVYLVDLEGDDGPEELPKRGSGSVTALAFGREGGLLAVGFNTGELTLWELDVEPPRQVPAKPPSSTAGSIDALTFGPSGNVLAVGSSDGRVALWDLEDGEIPFPAAHAGAVTDLAFSPDGDQLISSDELGVLHVWDIQAERLLGEAFAISREQVEGVDISSPEPLAAVPRYGSLALVRSAFWSPDAALARACAIAGRRLTATDRRAMAPGLQIPQPCS